MESIESCVHVCALSLCSSLFLPTFLCECISTPACTWWLCNTCGLSDWGAYENISPVLRTNRYLITVKHGDWLVKHLVYGREANVVIFLFLSLCHPRS